jgi:hypothetical protein
MVIALAGRRIDGPSTSIATFPLERLAPVQRAICDLFVECRAQALVCSAACGADLVALAAARALGLRRCIVLPYAREAFRDTSVVDRPGAWGEMFDALCDDASEAGELVELALPAGDQASYLAANERILDEAVAIAGAADGVVAVVVWNGPRASGDDATAEFRRAAVRRGLRVQEIRTVDTPGLEALVHTSE